MSKIVFEFLDAQIFLRNVYDSDFRNVPILHTTLDLQANLLSPKSTISGTVEIQFTLPLDWLEHLSNA